MHPYLLALWALACAGSVTAWAPPQLVVRSTSTRTHRRALAAAPLPPLCAHDVNACDAVGLSELPSPPPAAADGAVERRRFMSAAASAVAALSAVAVAAPPRPAQALGTLPETAAAPRFVQHAVLNVPVVEDAVRFYTQGLGMRILRTRADTKAGTNTTFVGFGPEQLSVPQGWLPGVSSFAEYGGHFSLELVGPLSAPSSEDEELPYFDAGNGFQYIQMGVDNYRISKVIQSGGQVVYGYGYLQIIAPGGHKLVVFSGVRRDPMMFVALKVADVKRSVAWYKDALGMSELPYPQARDAPEWSVFEPKQPAGSVFMGYDSDGAGVLLIPRDRKDKAPITPGLAYGKLALLATDVEVEGARVGAVFAGKAPGTDTSVAVVKDPDGYTTVLVEYDDWVKELPK